MDGTWLYYSLIEGRGSTCPIKQKYGNSWERSYNIDWMRLPQIIQNNLYIQLNNQNNMKNIVKIVRTSVFTSMRQDTPLHSQRSIMVSNWHKANFDVQK